MTTTHAQVITAPDQRTVTFLFPTQTTPVLRGDGKEIPSSSGTHGAHGTYHPHGSSVQSICAVSERDGYRLYTGSRDSCTNVFQLRRGRRDYQHVASLQGHVDWVNDVVALGHGGDGIVGTCSSDGTCRVWGADGGLRTCLAGHGDYVTGLASALVRPRLWSCGLGKLGGEVFGWDVEEGRRSVSFAGVELGQSAYCVASLGGIASFSDCVCVGLSGRERNVVVLDGRSEEMVCRLMGHEGTVRRAVVGGGMVYTGGGDGLIKGWDLRYVQEGVGGHHPVHTIRCHEDSVWCLQYDEGYVYSSGRDGRVYRTDTRNSLTRLVVDCGEVVTGMCVVDNQGSSGSGATSTVAKDVWLGFEASSTVTRYQIESGRGTDGSSDPSCAVDSSLSPRKQQKMHADGNLTRNVRPLVRCTGRAGTPVPTTSIPGLTRIQSLWPLTDKIHLLARDLEGNVTLLDVTQAREVEKLGSVPDAGAWDELRARMFDPTQSALTWFQPEASLGVVAGRLLPSSCFLCETYTRHLGHPDAPSDEKINVAELMLKTLFANWRRGMLSRDASDTRGKGGGVGKEGSQGDAANPRTTVLPFVDSRDTMVMVSGNHASLPWKKNCCDMDGTEDVPDWVASCVLNGSYPISKQLKMSFVLLPKQNSGLPPMGQSSLTAPRVLVVEKMLDYVIKRLKAKGVECHKGLVMYTKRDDVEGTIFTTSPGQVVLECDGNPVPSNFTVAAIRQWMWKKPDTLRIEYSVCKGGVSIGLPKIKIPEYC